MLEPPRELDELLVQLPSGALERFTAMLVSRPPAPLLLEETLSGLAGVLDMDGLALFVVDDQWLRPVMVLDRQRGDLSQLVSAQGREVTSLWRVVDSGMPQLKTISPEASSTTELWPQYAQAIHASALAALPIQGADGSVFGVLVVFRTGAPRPFSPGQSNVLRAVARVLSVCLERDLRRTEDDTTERVTLTHLSRVIESLSNEASLQKSALAVVRPQVPGASLCFVRWNPAQQSRHLEILRFEGLETLEFDLREQTAADDAVLLEAVLSGSEAFIDVLPTPLSGQEGRFAQVGVRSAAVLPLESGLALLALRRASSGVWRESERRFLSATARTIGGALERLRVNEALFEARLKAELLAGLSDALQTAQTADEVTRIAMQLIAPMLQATNVISLRIERTPERTLVASMGAWGDVPAEYQQHFRFPGVPIERTKLTRLVVEENRACYFEAYTRDSSGIQVSLGIEPVRNTRFEVIAVISVGRDPNLGGWRTSERDLLARAAATVGLALERTEIREELLRAKQRAEVLSKLSDVLQVVHSGEEVAARAMELLAPNLRALNIITLKVDRLPHGIYLRSIGLWGQMPELYSGYFEPPGVNIEATRISKNIVQTATPYYHTEYVDPDISALTDRQVSIGLEPVLDSSGHVVAILSVGRAPEIGHWQASEIELLSKAAATVGLALERAQNRALLEQRAAALEAKSAEIETFVYSVSHDLKSPMVSLEGMSVLLEEAVRERQFDELEFFVSRLRANVQSMTGLVSGLLELSRIGRVSESPP
jgi:GAF domain-containing protein